MTQERKTNMDENIEGKSAYEDYRSQGGIINEKEYQSVLEGAHDIEIPPAIVKGVELIAEYAGIALHSTKESPDPRILLYGALRTDTNKDREKYHHSQMSDQRLFAEVLRMVGDEESLQKLIRAYSNISLTPEPEKI